jgi:hypothetical protein
MVKSVQVYDKGLERKFLRLEKELKDMGGRTTDFMMKLGVAHAKVVAPKRTGRTASLIIGKRHERNGGFTATIISKNSTPNKKWNGGTFSLPRWLAESNRALSHIKTGNPRYMDATVAYLQMQKRKVARQGLTKINMR